MSVYSALTCLTFSMTRSTILFTIIKQTFPPNMSFCFRVYGSLGEFCSHARQNV